jgi:hypothetical protein
MLVTSCHNVAGRNNVLELIQAVNQRYPEDLILITGSPAEFVYVDKVRFVANVKNALNFAGQVTFSELPPLYTL